MPWASKPALLLSAVLASLALVILGTVPVASAAGAPISEDACAAPAPGTISCAAQILVSPRTHRPIRPRVERVRRVRRHLIGHDLAAPGQPAPQPLTPAYLQQAYDLTSLSATRGLGDTVAVVGAYDDPSAASDLATFRSTYGLPACTTASGCFQQLNEQGQPSPLPSPGSDWAEEESMDIEAVSSLCPNCRIDLVEAATADPQDLQAAISAAIAAGANQVSISGDGLYSQSPFTDFSTPGVSILAATGDNGALPPGQDAYPAALPYVTAVGGTALQPSSTSSPTARGVTETAWSGAASGCDTTEQPLPYQPADGCSGRSYADVSADADPATGLTIYSAAAGGWFDGGGTSLATPLVAAFEAVTGIDGSTPAWAYADAAALNDPTAGAGGGCAGQLPILCAAGYDGPTGAGSISGQIVAGAPGVGLPSFGPADAKTYTRRVTDTSAWLAGGVYPNGEPTSYYWEYGRTTAYGARTSSWSVGSGPGAVAAPGRLADLRAGTRYHYRLVATNPAGVTYGYDHSLRTSGHAITARSRERERRARRARRRRRHDRGHRGAHGKHRGGRGKHRSARGKHGSAHGRHQGTRGRHRGARGKHRGGRLRAHGLVVDGRR